MQANGNTVMLDDRPGVPKSERYKVVGDNLPSNFEPHGKPVRDFANQGGICASPVLIFFVYPQISLDILGV